MKKFAAVIFCLIFAFEAWGADVEVWRDPSIKIPEMKKIFVMPVSSKLKAGSQLMPEKQLNKDLQSWTIEGIHSALKGTKIKLIVKTLDELIEDMKFIYGDEISSGDVFFKRASEMGYTAFITSEITQKFETEHIPESIRTYTEYREIQKRDRKGRIIETIRIPEERTEIIPAHDVTYLHTVYEPKIFFTGDHKGDHKGAARGNIYREYQGGPVMKVVENLIKATMKNLFSVKK